VASGGDGGDERDPAEGDSYWLAFKESKEEVGEALSEARRLIQENSEARDALAALIKAFEHRTTFAIQLDMILGAILRYNWNIVDRIKGEPEALAPAEKAAGDAASLAIWVNGLVHDLPSIFPSSPGVQNLDGTYRIPPVSRNDFRLDIVDMLGRIQQMATERAIIARNYPDRFGVGEGTRKWPKSKGTTPQQRKAARRFAIGHLALAVQKLTSGLNNDIVRALADALFPGDPDDEELVDKTLGEYRATAAKSGQAIADVRQMNLLWDV
jgi:hypothetical protein